MLRRGVERRERRARLAGPERRRGPDELDRGARVLGRDPHERKAHRRRGRLDRRGVPRFRKAAVQGALRRGRQGRLRLRQRAPPRRSRPRAHARCAEGAVCLHERLAGAALLRARRPRHPRDLQRRLCRRGRVHPPALLGACLVRRRQFVGAGGEDGTVPDGARAGAERGLAGLVLRPPRRRRRLERPRRHRPSSRSVRPSAGRVGGRRLDACGIRLGWLRRGAAPARRRGGGI